MPKNKHILISSDEFKILTDICFSSIAEILPMQIEELEKIISREKFIKLCLDDSINEVLAWAVTTRKAIDYIVSSIEENYMISSETTTEVENLAIDTYETIKNNFIEHISIKEWGIYYLSFHLDDILVEDKNEDYRIEDYESLLSKYNELVLKLESDGKNSDRY